eukprot:gene46767-63365_t
MAAWLKLRLGRGCPPIVAKVSNRLDRNDQHFPVAQGYRAWLRWHPSFVDHVVAMSPAILRLSSSGNDAARSWPRRPASTWATGTR